VRFPLLRTYASSVTVGTVAGFQLLAVGKSPVATLKSMVAALAIDGRITAEESTSGSSLPLDLPAAAGKSVVNPKMRSISIPLSKRINR